MIRHILLIVFVLYYHGLFGQQDYMSQAKADISNGKYENARELLLTHLTSSSIKELSLLGEIEMRLGKLDEAESYLQNAIEKLESNSEYDQELYAQLLNQLALVYWNKGQDEEARTYMSRAIDVRSSASDISRESLAASFNDFGLITSRSNPQNALEYYDEALGLYREAYGRVSDKVAQGIINKGIIFHQLGMHGDAELHYRDALNLVRQMHPEGDHPTEAFILTNLGKNESKKGNLNNAIEYYKEALDIYVEIYGDRHPEVANAYNLIGEAQLNQMDYDNAIENIQKALIANSNEFNNTDPSTYPGLTDYYQPYTLLYSLIYKARAFQQLHLNKTLKFKHLREAMTALDKSDSLIINLRQSIHMEQDKLTLSSLASDIYGEAVNLAVMMGKRAFIKKPYFEKAFTLNEKGKAAILQEAINNSRAKKFAGVPEEIQSNERELLSQINYLERALADAPPQEEEKALRDRLFELRREHQQMIDMMETRYPSYYQLKYAQSAPSVSDLQNSLNPDQAILSYFPAENVGKLFIFLITAKKFEVEEKLIDNNFHRYIRGLRNGIYFRDQETFLLTSEYLCDLLIPKLPGNIKKLLVVPSGKLGFVPFETLINDRVTGDNYMSLPYLLRNYDISYSYSTSLHLQDREKVANKRILLMAPVVFQYENMSLPNLFATEKECNAISSSLRDEKFDITLKLRQEAQENVLKNLSGDNYKILHLATHGLIDENEPALSRIYLKDGTDDGRLFTGEIYNLNLNSNLVTLSACETGLGRISKGEGILGFTRALLYAGASNIIVSLWTVNDESTADLMVDFYTQLPQASIYGESLRQAKLNMINNQKYADPYFWAPFILIGE